MDDEQFIRCDKILAERSRLLDAAEARLARGPLDMAERARLEYLERLQLKGHANAR